MVATSVDSEITTTEWGSLSMRLGLRIPLFGKVSIAPEVSRWISDVDAWAVSCCIYRRITSSRILNVYGFAGGLYSNYKLDFDADEVVENSNKKFGGCFGSSFEFNFKSFGVFIEFRASINHYQPFVFTLGGTIPL